MFNKKGTQIFYPYGVIASFFIVANCTSKSADLVSETNTISIPSITGQVDALTSQSVLTSQSNVGVQINGTSNPSNIAALNAKNFAKIFLGSGKIGDRLSCTFKSLVNHGLMKSDGSNYVVVNSDGSSSYKIKSNILVEGGQLSSLNLYYCPNNAVSNSMLMSISKSNQNVVLKFKMSFLGQDTSINLSGNYNGTNWIDKSLQFEQYSSTLLSKYQIDQTQNSMRLNATIDYVDNTSSNDWQIYSHFGLTGSKVDSYYMDQGSALYSINGSADVTAHWDETGSTASSSSYASSIASPSLIPLPVVAPNSFFSAEEVWNCNADNLTQIDFASLSEEIKSEITQCQSNF